MDYNTWYRVPGSEIEDSLDRGDPVDDLVPECQAVYVWKRSLLPPAGAANSPSTFVEWIDRVLKTPSAVVAEHSLSHFARLNRLEVGGGGLSDQKHQTLQSLATSPQHRKLIIKYIKNLDHYLPALYVGETNNLVRRTKQHLNSETDFAVMLEEELGLIWADVDLHYWPLAEAIPRSEEDESVREIRTLLELMAARATIAGCATRPG